MELDFGCFIIKSGLTPDPKRLKVKFFFSLAESFASQILIIRPLGQKAWNTETHSPLSQSFKLILLYK